MGGPVLLAIHIMIGRLRERQIDNPITFSLRGIQRWLQVYQFAVEREIVARYTSISIPGDGETLLTTLDLEIDSLRDNAGEEEND